MFNGICFGQMFQRNQQKNNLLSSATIELFEYIRKESIQPLIAYTVEEFGEKIKDFTYTDTFKGLKTIYDAQK
jgi:protein phosphatase-4 regulatory subunit 3